MVDQISCRYVLSLKKKKKKFFKKKTHCKVPKYCTCTSAEHNKGTYLELLTELIEKIDWDINL